MKKQHGNQTVIRLIYSALCLALAMVLPLLTAQIREIGNALCLIHIPVFLCGFLCGWPWGLAVGLVAPLLRSMVFGMPAIFPNAVGMSFELAAYGAVSGALYRVLPKKLPYLYVSLISAMIAGRIIWGAARFVMAGLTESSFPMSAFWAGAVVNAVPGMILHLIVVPVIVLALRKARLIPGECVGG